MEDTTFKIHERLKIFPPALLVYIFYRRLVEHGVRATWLWVWDKVVRRTQGFSVPTISRVAPDLYVGGQHRQWGLSRMRKLGITAVVNMREESDDGPRGLGLDHYLWVETTDDTPPTLKELADGARFIEQQISEGHGVYIHCAAGVGRAPTMAAAYLISQGATAAAAWKTIRAGRPFIRPTPPQIRAIAAFGRQHRTL
ncbi:MAG: dual specificity protein phosphatase family protein [Anaerolineae bacterium]|nr:dual specificity protein phosphatase family protein [Anaerolineae bacterium]